MISFKTIVEMTQQFRPMIRVRALLTVLAVVILVIPATAAALEIGDQAPDSSYLVQMELLIDCPITWARDPWCWPSSLKPLPGDEPWNVSRCVTASRI